MQKIVKIRVKVNEKKKNGSTIEKINKAKNSFFEKIIKIFKYLVKPDQKKERKCELSTP